MFGFGKKKGEKTANADTDVSDKSEQPDNPGFFGRLKQGLSKTRSGLVSGIAGLLKGGKKIDDEVLEELETCLLTSDVGVEATQSIIDDLTERMSRQQLADSDALFSALREDMTAILQPCTQSLAAEMEKKSADKKPFVILMVGVNGVGKTTTIGKLAKRFQGQGLSVMLAAGDTFRAAAVEQLKIWGERNDIAVIAQPRASDPASVVFDAMEAATARGVDVLIADTAGRLHTQVNLMEELKKIRRVMRRLDENAPHEVMLVVDAGTGQNALTQAQQFHHAVSLTGITLTKLDGTAKGGVIFAMAKNLGIPIRFIGVGESIDDLREFNGEEFVDALLSKDA